METKKVRTGQTKRPELRLKDWRWVETVLAFRLRGLTTDAVAKSVGMPRSSLSNSVMRIRWMAEAELGPGVPLGTTDQKVTRAFITQWDKGSKRTRRGEEWRQMSAEEGREVEDAIRKIAHRSENGK